MSENIRDDRGDIQDEMKRTELCQVEGIQKEGDEKKQQRYFVFELRLFFG